MLTLIIVWALIKKVNIPLYFLGWAMFLDFLIISKFAKGELISLTLGP
jgi:hypothetical protein